MNTFSTNIPKEIIEIKEKGKTVCFVSGNFNIIHPGHIRFLTFAAEQADLLVVGLYDEQISLSAYFSNQERKQALESLSFVDYVLVVDTDVTEVLNKLAPEFVVKGKEFEKQNNIESAPLQQTGGKLLFSSGEKQLSTRALLAQQRQEASPIAQAIQHFHKRYNLDKTHLQKGMKAVGNLNVAVIGDLIVDEYQECLPIGMSQEDPTIAVSPLQSFKFVGGAGIVAAHAAKLGANVDFYSVCGTDELGDFARHRLAEYNVDGLLLNDPTRPTTHKLRYRAKDKTLLRVNNYRGHDISSDLVEHFVALFRDQAQHYDLLIFSDFSFGVACPALIESVSAICEDYGVSVVADSQTSSQIGDLAKFSNLLLTTPTEIEARQAANDNVNGLEEVSFQLAQKLAAKNVVITLGAEGILIRHKSEILETGNLPALADSALDTAGAGDAFLTTTSLLLKTGLSIWEAAFMGSIASSVQVNIRGNVPLAPESLIEKLDALIQ